MHSALSPFVSARPDARDAVEPAGRLWKAQVVEAFLDGYDEVAQATGTARARTEAGGLLELFVLEKAMYELNYELDNRPEWVRIPLAGVLEALDRSG
jgi:maltose alpha-D-glucosyltransferase/alpha-amylase